MGICFSFKKRKIKEKLKEERETIKINIKNKVNTTLDKATNINDKTNVTIDKTEIERIPKLKNDISENNNITVTEKNLINITQNNDEIDSMDNNNLLFSIRDEFNSSANRNIPYSPHTFEIVTTKKQTIIIH